VILSDLLQNTNLKMSPGSPCAKSNDKIPLPGCTSAPSSPELYFHRCAEKCVQTKWENKRL